MSERKSGGAGDPDINGGFTDHASHITAASPPAAAGQGVSLAEGGAGSGLLALAHLACIADEAKSAAAQGNARPFLRTTLFIACYKLLPHVITPSRPLMLSYLTNNALNYVYFRISQEPNSSLATLALPTFANIGNTSPSRGAFPWEAIYFWKLCHS